jgi:glycosyltransferase involved in cell wall biosynthesis
MNPPTPRTLLVVAAEFPPVKTIGRIRTVKFIEHLREFGWQAVVLTIAPNGTTIVADPALMAEEPAGTPVHRVPVPDLEASAARFVKNLIGKGDRTAAPGAAAMPMTAPGKTASAPTAGGGTLDRLHHLLTATLRNCIHIPDPYILWAGPAIAEGLRICAERHIDAIYTTLPPFSAALVGNQLKHRTGLPWIVDYRDLWTGDVLREWVPPLRRRLETWLERRWIRTADAVIAVSDEKESFLQRLHAPSAARWSTITNGYDIEEFAGIDRMPRAAKDTVSFVYTGRLFKNRRGYAFAEALGALKRERPDLARKVRVSFYGGISSEIRSRYDSILAQHGIADQFAFLGDVAHLESKTAQVNTDYLLLIVDTGETADGVIPGKLFEYVAARRPIFALCGPGATANIIRQGGLGRVVDPEDVAGCKAALLEILALPVPAEPDIDEAFMGRFDRRLLTQRLAGLLDQVVEEARIPRPRHAASVDIPVGNSNS